MSEISSISIFEANFEKLKNCFFTYTQSPENIGLVQYPEK